MGLMVLAAMTALPTAHADDAKPSPPPAKTQLMQGPTLRETGRIAPMFVQGNGVEIQKRSDLGALKENSIQSASNSEERPLPQPRVGVIDHVVLDRQIKQRFSAARDCRLEVGRRKQLPLAHVTAGTLTLRWTILPSGEVAGTVVVATTPADSELVDCVKRHMVSWTFTRPRGGSVSVERTLSFR
jgi:hypothetical protein